MQKFVTLFSLLVLFQSGSSFGGPGFGGPWRSGRVQLSPSNPGDVLLVSQLMVAVTSYGHCKPGDQIDVQSPLAVLCPILLVIEHNKQTYFLNKKSGRILLIVKSAALKRYHNDVKHLGEKYKVKLEIIFNELLGVNNLRFSPVTYEFFCLLGDIFAEIVGVGCKPTGFLDLGGLLIYKRELPPDTCAIDVSTTPLQHLFAITDLRTLLTEIGLLSCLIDEGAQWNFQFIFYDCAITITTKSGLKIGSSLGNKSVLKQGPAVVELLANALTEEQRSTFLQQLLITVSFGIAENFAPSFELAENELGSASAAHDDAVADSDGEIASNDAENEDAENSNASDVASVDNDTETSNESNAMSTSEMDS